MVRMVDRTMGIWAFMRCKIFLAHNWFDGPSKMLKKVYGCDVKFLLLPPWHPSPLFVSSLMGLLWSTSLLLSSFLNGNKFVCATYLIQRRADKHTHIDTNAYIRLQNVPISTCFLLFSYEKNCEKVLNNTFWCGAGNDFNRRKLHNNIMCYSTFGVVSIGHPTPIGFILKLRQENETRKKNKKKLKLKVS
jgi:hypothetical protein